VLRPCDRRSRVGFADLVTESKTSRGPCRTPSPVRKLEEGADVFYSYPSYIPCHPQISGYAEGVMYAQYIEGKEKAKQRSVLRVQWPFAKPKEMFTDKESVFHREGWLGVAQPVG